MAPVNASFPPFNPLITTDNVQFPAANIYLLTIIVGLFTAHSFSWHYRSAKNTFMNEYKQHRDDTERSKLLQTSTFLWFSYYINPVLSMFFALGFLIWTWTAYAVQSNGYFQNPRDIIALIVTITLGLWIVIMYCVVIADIYWKHSLVYSESKVQPSGVKTNNSLIIDQLSSIDDIGYHGLNATTKTYLREVIVSINALTWGMLPLSLTMIGITWDRRSTVPSNLFIGNTEAAMTGVSGILLSLTWSIHTLYNIRKVMTLYRVNSIGFKQPVLFEYNHMDIKYSHVGLSSDVLGLRMPLKGAIPYQYCPDHFIHAKVWYAFAFGFLVYNDVLQATACFFVLGVLPYIMRLVAKSEIYFISYDAMCWFFFFLFSYWIQGVMYYTDSQRDVNFQLITLNMSATYPGMSPTTYYGTSISCVYIITFLLCVRTFFRTITGHVVSDHEAEPDLLASKYLVAT
jgi:hypothetical protein